MTSHPICETMVSTFVKFDDSLAVLGLNTNGCVPTRVYGLIAEGEIRERNDGTADESFWLKLVTNPDFSHIPGRNVDRVPPQDVDFLAFGEGEDINAILGAVVNASMVDNYDTTPAKTFISYFSNAQRKADQQNTTDVEIEGCSLRARSTATGFELAFTEGKDVISRLNAKFDEAGIKAVIELAESITRWQHFVSDVIQTRRAPDEDYEVRVPGM